jgi:hypothetical protein
MLPLSIDDIAIVVIPTTWLEITISLKYNCQLYLIKNTHNNIYADDRG